MRQAHGTSAHSSDEELVSLLESDAPAPEKTRRHVAQCLACTERIGELQRTRRLLQATGVHEVPPQHDLARDAMTRLRLRDVAIGNVNELMHVLRTLVGALTKLLSGSANEGEHRG